MCPKTACLLLVDVMNMSNVLRHLWLDLILIALFFSDHIHMILKAPLPLEYYKSLLNNNFFVKETA